MADVDPAMLEARAKLRERFGDGQGSRLGGKGSTRRKKRVAHRPAAVDDKKLQGMLKRLGLSTIPGIEEVTMLTSQKTVLHFANPKVQAAPGANTYLVSGHAETKEAPQLPPGFPSGKISEGMLQELVRAAAANPNEVEAMKQLQELMKTTQVASDRAAVAEGKAGAIKDDDDDVPDLEENFDAAAGMD